MGGNWWNTAKPKKTAEELLAAMHPSGRISLQDLPHCTFSIFRNFNIGYEVYHGRYQNKGSDYILYYLDSGTKYVYGAIDRFIRVQYKNGIL